jgi:hypothetical protein
LNHVVRSRLGHQSISREDSNDKPEFPVEMSSPWGMLDGSRLNDPLMEMEAA